MNMKPKILFWQTSDWFNFNLAYSMNEKIKKYAIIDTVNKPKEFFENQKFVSYEKIWFYHNYIKKSKKYDEVYLQKFEEKYKINLWLLAYNERIFYNFNQYYKFSTDEVLSILEQECRFFESVLDEINPDFLIISLTWQHQGELLRQLCKSKNIKILMINPSDSSGGTPKWIISEDFGRIDYFEKRNFRKEFQELNEVDKKIKDLEKSIENLSKFRNEYIKNSQGNRIKAGIQTIFSKNSNEKTHYTYFGRTRLKVLKNELISESKTRVREKFIDKKFQNKINDNDKFIFFPLHTEQERSLLISAPFYTNQLEVVKHVAKSTPIGYKIYVKEHPFMRLRSWRSPSEYKKFLNIPNVVLIHPNVKSEELIKKSSLVISINSTASFEAAFYEKPSINFAAKNFSILSFAYVVENINDLPKIIRQALKTKVDFNELEGYLQISKNEMFQFDYNQYVTDYGNYFHHGGNLVNVQINYNTMKKFLEKYKEKFDKLTLEYIRKIEQHNDSRQ